MRSPDYLCVTASAEIQLSLKLRTFTQELMETTKAKHRLSDRQLLVAIVHATRQHLYSKEVPKTIPIPADAPQSNGLGSSAISLVRCPVCNSKLNKQKLPKHLRLQHPNYVARTLVAGALKSVESKEEREAMRRHEGYTKTSSPNIRKPFRN
ncbi:hypothetical protein [Hymenobacter jeollabukensis]|uniref:hypothetical protein n=1 Tax=Hymenobacter jeollabukensis TaxID=2025313 RepID=UPI0010FE5ACE|nr:hypothetical protein [Hymenobacter jeollabukensis]